jgi:hypothetical protein
MNEMDVRDNSNNQQQRRTTENYEHDEQLHEEEHHDIISQDGEAKAPATTKYVPVSIQQMLKEAGAEVT